MVQRLTRIENALINNKENPSQNVDDKFISGFLPLKSIDDVKELNLLLNTEEAKKQFVNIYFNIFFNIKTRQCVRNTYILAFLQKTFLLKCGGSNARNNIHRMLKKTFTDECATLCSWKGIRNNFRFNDLNIIKVIKST